MSPVLLLGLGALALLAMRKPKGSSAPPAQQSASIPTDLVNRMNIAITSKDGDALATVFGELISHPSFQTNVQVQQAAAMVKNLINQQQPVKQVVAGRSGRAWKVQVVSAFDDGTVIRDVFTPSGARIVRFKEDVRDPSSKHVYITHPESADPSMLSKAMQDFSIIQP